MQRWRTRHDIRGICFETGGGYMGPTNVLLPSSNPFSSSTAGPGPLQTNANIGLFQIPISASFLNPSATADQTYNPTVTQNPYQSGIFNNNLDISAVGGPYNSAHASLFGTGGDGSGQGGGGGGNVSGINYNPTNILSSNLPPPLQLPAQQPLNLGSINSSPRIQMMPMPPTQAGMMMPTTQPIAAGGVSPVLASMMAIPQQQQLSQGQTVIPGSASQAGGYDMPAPPQGVPGIPQMPMGGANAMGIPNMGGGMMMPQMRTPNQQGMVGNYPFNQVTADASNGLVPAPIPSVSAATQALQNNPQYAGSQRKPLTGGSQQAVGPSAPVSSDFQDYMDQAQQILNKLPAETDQAANDFKAAAADFIDDHKKKDHLLRKNHDSASLGVLSHYVDQAINKTTQAQAARREDAAKKLFATKYDTDAAGNKVMSEEQKSILRGSSPQARGSVHPKWRMAGNIAEMALGNTGIGRAIRAVDKASETAAEKRAVIDRENYGRFVTQLDNMIGSMDKAESGQGEDARALQTDSREQMDHNDTQLNNNLSNAYKQYIDPAKLQVEGYKAQLGALSDQGRFRTQGIAESEAPEKLEISRQNMLANQQRAQKGDEAFNLAQQKWAEQKRKDDLETQGLQQKLKGMPETQRGTQLANQEKIQKIYKDVADDDIINAWKARKGIK